MSVVHRVGATLERDPTERATRKTVEALALPDRLVLGEEEIHISRVTSRHIFDLLDVQVDREGRYFAALKDETAAAVTATASALPERN